MLPNASIASFNCAADGSYNGGRDSVNEPVQGIKGRYWDWALGNRPVPDDKVLKNDTIRKTIRTYRIVVKACEAGNIGSGEGCMQYPNGQYKPVGLLQEYGQGDRMYFGLMTGGYNSDIRRKGGVIRDHIGSVSTAVDPQTGKIIRDGLISNLDRLRISGRYIKQLEGWPQASYYDTYSWGNPIGEMLYEGVRYFASLTRSTPLSPTGAFTNQSDYDGSMNAASSLRIQDNGARSPIMDLTMQKSWSWAGRDDLRGDQCAKPVILLISDINSDYDGDNIPSNNDLKQTPLTGVSLPQQFSLSGYLDTITAEEKLNGKAYFFSKNSTDDCSAKTLNSLSDVKGMCPGGPAFEGTYSATAVAYYAHTHDFSVTPSESGIDIYSVTISSAFPELTFSKGAEKISVMPVNITQAYNKNTILSFLNYYILEWHTDREGTPFSVTIQVNFSDQPWGDDWEMDVIVTYKVDLLTTSALTPAAERTAVPLVTSGNSMVSGVFRNNGNTYYGFKNPDSADSIDDFIKIDSGKVVGLSIDSKVEKRGTSVNMGLGYTISGSSLDGTYLDLGLNSNFDSAYQTPPTCPSAKEAASNTTKCGKAHTTQQQIRTFVFKDGTGQYLPNPMWLAAKYGGFKDKDNIGFPDDGEWDSKVPGTPDNYFQATNISTLAAQLGAAFEAISKSVSTGTATSASVNSILGGGISIQTQYYPEYTDSNDVSVKWVGNIYGLFVDKWGNLREDSNRNGKLDVVTGDANTTPPNEQGDFVVKFNPTNAGGPKITIHRDIRGDNTLGDEEGQPNLEQVKTVWNTSQWLAGYTAPAELTGAISLKEAWEPYKKVPYRSSYRNTGGRRIYSYYPDDLDYLATLYPPGAQASPSSWTWKPVVLDNRFNFSTANTVEVTKLTPHMLLENGVGKATIFSKGSGQDFTITPYGPRPSGRIDIVIKEVSSAALEPVSLSVAASGNNVTITISCRENDGYASRIVQAINSKALGVGGMYGGNPLIKAAIPEGQDGLWVPAAAGAVNVNTTPEESTALMVEYIRGQDMDGFRNRTVRSPWKPADTITWRLGDIINSKPIIVGAPAFNFDLVYRDPSYYNFKVGPKVMVNGKWVANNRNSARRQVAYVGANDGMLHAVNLGFYGSLADGKSGYKTTSDNPILKAENLPKHDLGAEIWAYVPTAVLPHLQWLADLDYSHSYYVDLKPHLADIRNTTGSDLTATGGYKWENGQWRTILINGLRLGGRNINMTQNGDTRSYSEFFALDVNDPEEPPVLLWRFSHPRLGLTVGQPTVVSNNGRWYVILASGPTYDQATANASTGEPREVGKRAYEGVSNQSARLFVLDALTGRLVQEIDSQIPNSFFNDSFMPVVPNQLVRNSGTDNCQWDNHVAYFGLTVSADADGLEKGGVYRLKMVDTSGPVPTALPAGSWELTTLFNAERPVTGAINAANDSIGNLWVIFGTGRLWSKKDSEPCTLADLTTGARLQACLKNHEQQLFGIKEPLNSKGFMTFAEVPNGANLVDVSQIKVFTNGALQGASLYNTYRELQADLFSSAKDGYRRKIQTWSMMGDTGLGNLHEVVVTQPKIAGLMNGESLATFTSHEPSTDECSLQGQSYLYLVDTFTGLPAPYMGIFGFYDEGAPTIKNSDDDVIATQVTGYIHAGKGQSTEAVIIGNNVETTGQGGEIYNIPLPEGLLPQSTIISWREVFDMGFTMTEEDMKKGLPAPPTP